MKRVINAIKLLFGKLEVEITINKTQICSIVPSGIILKINTETYHLPPQINGMKFKEVIFD